jgi:hypothetical protein
MSVQNGETARVRPAPLHAGDVVAQAHRRLHQQRLEGPVGSLMLSGVRSIAVR